MQENGALEKNSRPDELREPFHKEPFQIDSFQKEPFQKEAFDADTSLVAEQSVLFVQTMQPAYTISESEQLMDLSYKRSDAVLDGFTFYRLLSCTTENIDDIYAFLNEKMVKFFTAACSFNKPLVYGIVSYEGITNLVIGLYDSYGEKLKRVLEGLLDGIELKAYEPSFMNRENTKKHAGLISAVPSVKIGEERQKFDLSALMKSLNGENYTFLMISRPISQNNIVERYRKIIGVRDACFSVSKRSISRQQGTARTESETSSHSSSETQGVNFGIGGCIPQVFLFLSAGYSKSSSESHTYSESVSETISQNVGTSAEVQNGFALELMEYADKAIERLRQGMNNGMWETAISYSADSDIASGIIKACVTGELSKPNPHLLPVVTRSFELNPLNCENTSIIVPKIVKGEKEPSLLCTPLTSEELGMLCSIPTDSVPDFELRRGKAYPLVSAGGSGVVVGKLNEGSRVLPHMEFSLSNEDLARHTFICGITGSGKTTTVKRILDRACVPFLVIESAKKEYRNIELASGGHPVVYTLGKPEINCPRFNPFYIQRGVSPQMHIDFLKDLFNASFSFYGPMPYILEKCLHEVYRKHGWNLHLGFHPYLVNTHNSVDMFEAEHIKRQYKKLSHKHLFPTMQDLKAEIKHYVEFEMDYESEVAGDIKTAILARLESLCSGAKGYMFNTHEYLDMDELMASPVVFELEGLADDADKAFCVGLLIAFVNEYRQVTKETASPRTGLSHLLVIEEAHRLLKNVDTERTSEDMGNPKGKAVEHFTNMIAEMRSYGQGVIIAEQIPTKLAPDVIKNSSNKIIQRLVAADDQLLVANTIGLTENEAIFIGNFATGTALCHKEGMSLPVSVKIEPVHECKVTDAALYVFDIEKRFGLINTSMLKECVADFIDAVAFKILNSILLQDYSIFRESVIMYREQVRSAMVKKNVELVLCEDRDAVYANVLAEAIEDFLLHGVYSIKRLPDNLMHETIWNLVKAPSKEELNELRSRLYDAYRDDLRYKGKYVISELVYNQMDQNTDRRSTVKNYFIKPDEASVNEILTMIEGRR